MQIGDGETTAKVPMSVLDGILPRLGAKRRYKASTAQMASMMKANEMSKPLRFKKRPDATGPETD
jgi:hypothetical protein